MAIQKKKLKWGMFESPQCNVHFERYIIETQEDLDAFKSEFPEINKFGDVYGSMQNIIQSGLVVLATDRHRLSGFPTWCIESKDLTHPSAIKRVQQQ